MIVFIVISLTFALLPQVAFAIRRSCGKEKERDLFCRFKGPLEEGDTFVIDSLYGPGSQIIFEEKPGCEALRLEASKLSREGTIYDIASTKPCGSTKKKSISIEQLPKEEINERFYEIRVYRDHYAIFMNGRWLTSYQPDDGTWEEFRGYEDVSQVCVFSNKSHALRAFDEEHKCFNPDLRIPKTGMIKFPNGFHIGDELNIRGVYCTPKEHTFFVRRYFIKRSGQPSPETFIILRNAVENTMLKITFKWDKREFSLKRWSDEEIECGAFDYKSCVHMLDISIAIKETKFVVQVEGVPCEIFHGLDEEGVRYLELPSANFEPFHVRLKEN